MQVENFSFQCDFFGAGSTFRLRSLLSGLAQVVWLTFRWHSYSTHIFTCKSRFRCKLTFTFVLAKHTSQSVAISGTPFSDRTFSWIDYDAFRIATPVRSVICIPVSAKCENIGYETTVNHRLIRSRKNNKNVVVARIIF